MKDVIISGAGPVGLFLAFELALARCSVLILEKAESPESPLKQLPFGIRGLTAPTIEALYRRGLLGELEIHKQLKSPHQHARQGPRRQAGHFAGIPFHEGDIDAAQWKYRLPGPAGVSLISEMQELERVLTRRAEALGVEIRRGHAIAGYKQTADGVVVQSGAASFTSRWLVGCDGSRSIVRKAGGFEFAGTEPEFTGYTVKASIADGEKLQTGRVLTSTGMYLQSQPGYIIIQDFDGGAFHDSGQPVTLEHVQEVLRRVSDTDVTISALHIATTWTDRARQAAAYRKGRVLLAGDAAHIHSPLGGQGLNLGLGDAMNLGWKLAATVHGHAPEGLLDTYCSERHPIGAQVLDWSRAQVALMRPDPGARSLNAIVRDIMNTRDGATYFAGRVWGVAMHYELEGAHPLTGHSVPEFLFGDGRRVGEWMVDGRGVLVDADGEAGLREVAEAYRLHYISGGVEEPLGLRAVLIRPDGIVAWAADRAGAAGEVGEAAGEVRAAADRWFWCEG